MPIFDNLEDFAHKGAFAECGAAFKLIGIQAIAGATILSGFCAFIIRAVIKIFEITNLDSHGGATTRRSVRKKKQASLQVLEVGGIAVDVKERVREERVLRLPFLLTGRALFKQVLAHAEFLDRGKGVTAPKVYRRSIPHGLRTVLGSCEKKVKTCKKEFQPLKFY
jgi:hypothetical protein